MPPLRWGVVGVGQLTHDFVTAVQIFPDRHTVVAVGSRNKANAERFAEEHNIPEACEWFKSIAKNANIDVVYVGKLNPEHYGTTKLMLEHGKSVLCEKPFTMNEKQTTELVNLARCKNIFLMEAVWSRCFPAYRKAEELIGNGSIGEDLQKKDRITNKELGRGAILDIGVYRLQFQQFVFRGLQPTNIVVNGALTKDGVDGTTGALISYRDGKLASITCSAELQMPNEGLIVGARRKLRLPNFWYLTHFPQSEVQFRHMNSAGLSYEADEVKRCLEAGERERPRIRYFRWNHTTG